MPDDTLQYACCDVNSRGVSYADGKIFVGRLDGKLVALDAKTGKELWTTKVVDYKQGSVITSPPLVVKNKVITGFGGGEYGARGSLQAYDVKTGKEALEDLDHARPRRSPTTRPGRATAGSTAARVPGWSARTTRRPTPSSGAPAIPAPWNTRCAAPATATTAS